MLPVIKATVLLVLLCGSSPALAQNNQSALCSESPHWRQPQLGSGYDSRRNETFVNLELPRPACKDDYGMRVGFSYLGRELRLPKKVTIWFFHVFCPRGESGASCNQITVLLNDAERISLGELIGTGMHVIGGHEGLWTDRYVTLSPETFMQIAHARKIVVLIGNKSFKLSEEYRKAMGELADSLKSAG